MKTCKLIIIAALAAVIFFGCERKREVKIVSPERGEIRSWFREPAKTRLDNLWRVTMPIDGRIGRIDLEPGDAVTKNQVLVGFDKEPLERALEEARAALTEAEKRALVNEYDKMEKTAILESEKVIQAANEALNAADAQIQAEKVRSDRAARELERHKELAENDAISQSELEDYLLQAEASLIELKKEQFNRAAINAIVEAYKLMPQLIDEWLGRKGLERQVISAKIAGAKARVALAQYRLRLAEIKAPINGVALERYSRGDGFFRAGEPLLLLGDLDKLEAEADVLTQDALRIAPGSEVSLEMTGRQKPLSGKVKRIEPYGFTKLSSLGVEQQRVMVIIELDERPPGLGVGYRLQARFYAASKENALIVPRYSVLQSPDGEYYVFKVEDGVLKRRTVKLGLQSDLELEIIDGLSEADRIVSIPDATMRDGEKVKATNAKKDSPL